MPVPSYPHYYNKSGGEGETRTHTPRVTEPSVFKTAAAMPIRLTSPYKQQDTFSNY